VERSGAWIEVRGLRKTFHTLAPFRRRETVALDGVSFTVPPFQVTAFLGPNGAGKTTTIKVILGLVLPDQGEVRVEPPGVAMGVLLEGVRNLYWRLTALENLIYFGVLRGLSRSQAQSRGMELLSDFDLAGHAHRPVSTLSRGMQQKVALAVALVNDPPLLLLDEPTLGLDISSALAIRARLIQLAEQEGKTILITTHQMDVAEAVADRVVIINHGRVVAEERVDELKRLFQRSDLELILPAGEWERAGQVLGQFPHRQLERSGGRVRVRFELPDLAGFYDLMRAMAELRVEFERLAQLEPKLEEIFLQFVGHPSPVGAVGGAGQLGG